MNNVYFGFLSSIIGGVLVAVVNYWFARKATRITFIKEQLEHLYGPLHYHTSLNSMYFDANRELMKASADEYGSESAKMYTKEALKYRTYGINTAIDIANRYIQLAIENNSDIIEVMQRNYHYIDEDDVEVFMQFVKDVARLKIESGKEDMLVMPIEVSLRLERISFTRPEFIERMDAKFRIKQAQLRHGLGAGQRFRRAKS